MYTFFFEKPDNYNKAKTVLVEMLDNNQYNSIGVDDVSLGLNVFTKEHKESFIGALNSCGINHKDYVVVGPKSC